VGGSVLVDAPNVDTLAVIRPAATTVVVLSAVCTHQRCLVDVLGTTLACPCHGSEFGEDGHVHRGPARRPLRTHAATLACNQVTITIG
jgi:Rieske Fe-S protein